MGIICNDERGYIWKGLSRRQFCNLWGIWKRFYGTGAWNEKVRLATKFLHSVSMKCMEVEIESLTIEKYSCILTLQL